MGSVYLHTFTRIAFFTFHISMSIPIPEENNIMALVSLSRRYKKMTTYRHAGKRGLIEVQ
jgi:hypothetical protein